MNFFNLWALREGRSVKGRFWQVYLYPLLAIKVHPPFAFAHFKGKMSGEAFPALGASVISLSSFKMRTAHAASWRVMRNYGPDSLGRGQVTDLGVMVLHFSGPMKSGHFPWNCPAQFRENQRKDTIYKMLKLQA